MDSINIKVTAILFIALFIAVGMELFKVNSHIKYKMFLLAIYFVPLQSIPLLHIGYFSIDEFILSILGFNIIVFRNKILKEKIIRILLLFSFIALISAIYNNELHVWIQLLITPLFVFVCIKDLNYKKSNPWVIVRAINNSIFIYFLIYIIAYNYGKISSATMYGIASSSAGGDITMFGVGARTVQMGIFTLELGHNQLAGLISILVIISIILINDKNNKILNKYLYVIWAITGIGIIVFTTSRGNLIGVILSVLFIILFSAKKYKGQLIIFTILLAVIVYVWGLDFINQFTSSQLERMSELFSSGLNSSTSTYRLDFLSETLQNAGDNLLGLGYYYYYNKQIDDAMLYSYVINGSGIICMMVFLYFIVFYIIKMVKKLIAQYNLITLLGVAIFIQVIVAGYSQTYLMGWRNYNYIVWLLFAVSYYSKNEQSPNTMAEKYSL